MIKVTDDVMRFWLLNLAVERPVWLDRLFPVVKDEALNVKTIPGRVASDYARGLMDLFDSGAIKLASKVPGEEAESEDGSAGVVERLLKLSNNDPSQGHCADLQSVYVHNRPPGMKDSFSLIQAGGESWEKSAEPEWGRLVSISTYSATEGQNETGELISADRDLILAYMGWYPEVNGEQILLDTIDWQTHTDFAILYWKRLPFIYHASFEVLPAQSRWNGRCGPQWFRDWWASTRSWYKKPWELPNWPSR